MDDIRSSFSRFKKDVKHRLRREKHVQDRVGADSTEGRADPLDSPLQSDHRTTASGHDEEGTRTSTDVPQARSRDRSPQPEPFPAGKGNDDPQTRGEDVDEKEADQRHSRMDPDIRVARGSGPNQDAHSSQPSPSFPHEEEPDST